MKSATILIAIVALSMPLVTIAVKAQKAPPPHQASDRSDRLESDLKDSVKSGQSEISKLVQTLMASGRDSEYVNGHAQVVGLDQPRPAKVALELVGSEARKCHVVYAPDEAGNNQAICLYIIRAKKTPKDVQERFFRVSLDGRLEKVVTLRSKLDDQGKSIRAERSKVDEDIDSPEIRKIFKTDMTFWLKDWLKKQQKLDAKKATASAAKSGAVAAASAAAAPATP